MMVKKIIINTALFLLPIAILSFAIDSFLSSNLKKSKSACEGEFSVWNDILEGRVNSDIVIYGSSRAWTQINPMMIADSFHKTSYNLGIDGHNFWLQYLRHKLLLANNKKPQLIIHSVDAYTLQKRPDLYNLNQFLPYMKNNEDIRKTIQDYEGFDKYDFVLPLKRYAGKNDAIATACKMFAAPEKDNTKRVKGYEGQKLTWNNDFENAQHKMKKYSVKIDANTIKLFEQYLQECKQKNIQVVFVYVPEYFEINNFISNKNEVMELYKIYSHKYNIPFYNFSNDSLSLNKSYYYNASHLNKTGAELFTNKFIGLLKQTDYFSTSNQTFLASSQCPL